jgi:hypothetical protein
MIHFKELRSGKDLAYFARRIILFNEISMGHSSKHLFDDRILKSNYFLVYDFDAKIELFVVFFIIAFLIKRIIRFRD